MEVVPRQIPGDMPVEIHQLRRRLLALGLVLVLVVSVITLVPGLADVRRRLADAAPGWLVLAVALEVLSCLAYVVAFRAAFCARMTWRMSYRIARIPCADDLPVVEPAVS